MNILKILTIASFLTLGAACSHMSGKSCCSKNQCKVERSCADSKQCPLDKKEKKKECCDKKEKEDYPQDDR